MSFNKTELNRIENNLMYYNKIFLKNLLLQILLCKCISIYFKVFSQQLML